MNKVKLFVAFIFSNFGPLIGFYAANLFWGFKVAVAISIALVVGEFIWLRRQKRKLSSFFYFSSALVVLFGIADLIIQKPFFMKFEAALTNIIFAVFFGMSLFKEKTIIQQFAEAQKRTSEKQSADKNFFFQIFTIFWCVYFVAKAAFYLWLNFRTSMNEALLIRMIVGKISFWIMMFISVGLPNQIWKLMEKWKLFPSQRNSYILSDSV